MTLARCDRADCRAPLVLLVGDTLVVQRCQMGHIDSVMHVAPQRTGFLSWSWDDDA